LWKQPLLLRQTRPWRETKEYPLSKTDGDGTLPDRMDTVSEKPNPGAARAGLPVRTPRSGLQNYVIVKSKPL
jgi:hypothetical protein